MPQINVNSANVIKFGFSASFDLFNRAVIFDTSTLSSYQGSSGAGIFNVQGICFSLVDQQGVELAGVDWNNPQIVPSVNQEYTLDISSLPFIFLFQNYKIIGYLKDADGTVYSTEPVFKKVCQPINFNDSGYVPGLFQITPDCVNNTLTVKELTVLTYNNTQPESISKSGTLYYPTGTIGNVSFTGTPFSNNSVYSGEYRIRCTSIGTFNLEDNIYVLVTYISDNPFKVNCTSKIADLLCCVKELQDTAIKHCNDAKGAQAKQKLLEISPFLATGLLAEINGQDASDYADYIRKTLNCNCGATSIHQNEMSPVNPSIYSIVINGVGGTSVPSPTINGATKTFNIASNLYQVVNKDSGDLAVTIFVDTSVANTVKYALSFNYDVMAGYILTAYENNPAYISRLQALLVTGLDLSGLDGKCVLSTGSASYTLQLTSVTSQDLVTSVTINGVIHLAPSNTYCNDATAIQTWLNTLSLGTFAVVFSLGVLTITSASNTNTLSTMVFSVGGAGGTKKIIMFQNSKYTIVQILQAIIDYLCGLTALQVALGNTLTLWQIDYNGNPVNLSLVPTNTQNDFNIEVANSIYNLVQRMNTLTGVTCAKIKSIFIDRPNDVFGTADRVYGTLNGDCAGMTDQQLAKIVFAAVSKYTDVKAIFCAIDCTTPASCPDVSNISLAMSGSNIGIYGLTWSSTPQASQTVTVRYKLTSSSMWLVATSGLLIQPNGNISGTSPYVIANPTPGQTYDVQIVNNCGGFGFTNQITVPTSSIYSGSYYLENSLYLICGASPVTLYSSAPFGAGITMYSDIGLTTPVTGYAYVTTNGANIFNLNTSTGVVGADTGNACSVGTAATYILGNNTGTICTLTPQTLYTNGAFAVGGILYLDAALTTPVTGYSYVVVVTGALVNVNNIYNLNSITGQIGVATGLSCNFAVGELSILGCVGSGEISEITFDGIAITGIFPMASGDNQNVNTSNNTTATLVVTVTGTFGSIRVIDSFGAEYCQDYTGAGSYSFTGFVINAAGSTNWSVTMDCAACIP